MALVVKNLPANAGEVRDSGSIPGFGRFHEGGHGNPPQYSCLEKSHGQRSLEGYSPWGCKELDTTEWLCTHATVLINDIEHLFTYLLPICISSLKKYLLKSFAHFKIKFLLLLFFLLLVSRNSLYTLDINPLSNTWFGNIFSHSVNCLFTLLTAWKAIDCFLYCTEAF